MNPLKAATPPVLAGPVLAGPVLAGPVLAGPVLAGPVLAGPAPERGLRGRSSECETLDRLVENVRAGHSQVLVLRGEAGAGKTALLEYLLERASGCCLARAAGVESEMELAFAALHQLCAPFLDRLERLPGPQRDALSTAFNLREGVTPDRFAVGLAVLSLLSEVAGERPLVCVVDDAHWLDLASARALAFVARHLAAKPAAVVFAHESDGEQNLTGLAELVVRGLADGDARALLSSAVAGPLDERVRDRIVAETRGNPLALLEVARRLTPEELAGGFGSSGDPAPSSRIEESFRGRLTPLPPATRLLLLVAAAEPLWDPVLVWRAAGQLGVKVEAAAAAPQPHASDLLLDGLAVLATEGYAAGAPILARELAAFRPEEVSTEEVHTEEELRWLPLACRVSHHVWDDESWYLLSARLMGLARQAGALAVLPVALRLGAGIQLLAGEFTATASIAAEAEAVARATGNPAGPSAV